MLIPLDDEPKELVRVPAWLELASARGFAVLSHGRASCLAAGGRAEAVPGPRRMLLPVAVAATEPEPGGGGRSQVDLQRALSELLLTTLCRGRRPVTSARFGKFAGARATFGTVPMCCTGACGAGGRGAGVSACVMRRALQACLFRPGQDQRNGRDQFRQML